MSQFYLMKIHFTKQSSPCSVQCVHFKRLKRWLWCDRCLGCYYKKKCRLGEGYALKSGNFSSIKFKMRRKMSTWSNSNWSSCCHYCLHYTEEYHGKCDRLLAHFYKTKWVVSVGYNYAQKNVKLIKFNMADWRPSLTLISVIYMANCTRYVNHYNCGQFASCYYGHMDRPNGLDQFV